MKTKSPRPATLARAEAGIRAAYLRTYECRSCDYKYDAQQNLIGRTHYVDEDTLRGFESRILNSGHSPDGMVYWIVESVGSKPGGGPNKRFVAFDLLGTVISDRADFETGEGWYRTSKDAEKAGAAWLAAFDSAAHTVAALKARATREITEARRVLSALRAKPATV